MLWIKFCFLFHDFTATFNTYNVGLCEFRDGYIISSKSQDVGDTSTERECERKVKKEDPSAMGVTWFKAGSYKYTCNAEYGTEASIEYDSIYPNHRACIFQGIHVALNTWISLILVYTLICFI